MDWINDVTVNNENTPLNNSIIQNKQCHEWRERLSQTKYRIVENSGSVVELLTPL